jgi:uncharacterized protein
MNRKTLLQASALAICLSFTLGATAQNAAPAREKVVFQVSDNEPAKWNTTLNNAKNVQEVFGADKVDIEIVAYGPGINMLKDDAVAANRVTEAVQTGIQIVACENTMTAQKLSRADMNKSVGYVKAGVVELMKRQREGWAYIRP